MNGMPSAEIPRYSSTANGAVSPDALILEEEATMKYTAFWLTLAAACAFSARRRFAQGAGQGQHEVGSGVGNPSRKRVPAREPIMPDKGRLARTDRAARVSAAARIQTRSARGTSKPAVQAAQWQGPDSAAPINNGAVVNPGGPMQPAQRHAAGTPHDWRFVYNNGMWWYYLPNKTWAYYQNGGWQNYEQNVPHIAERPNRTTRLPEATTHNQPENKTPSNNATQNNKSNNSINANKNNTNKNNNANSSKTNNPNETKKANKTNANQNAGKL